MADSFPWQIAATTYATIRATAYDVALLPWGATEAHNLHLPYATDNYQAEAVAHEAARQAWEQKAKVAVLPAIPFGVQSGQLDIPLDINLNPSTQYLVLRDIAQSVERAGIKKLVVFNGHGGNNFRQMLRELSTVCGVLTCEVSLFRIPHDGIVDKPGDHADEFETSLMLHLHPELVAPLAQAGNGAARAFKIQAMREGWAWTQRQWSQVTRDTGVGDPSLATADKGRRLFETMAAQLCSFLVELAQTPMDGQYASNPA